MLMIYIAGDKHGFKAIQMVESYLTGQHIPFENIGVKNMEENLKLEDMIPPVVKNVLEHEENKAVLVCGTGIGVEVGANKFSGIRACLATNEQIARWAAEKDKCNVLCLAGWDIDQEQVNKIVQAWLTTKYDGSETRLKMFEEFDKWH
jgi:RpiB/LacA/LacB family sugar-phosphate isomerase